MIRQYGAHELVEVNEILSNSICGINQFELFRPHVNGQELNSILEKQLGFMVDEFNNLVQVVKNRLMVQGISYPVFKQVNPIYGLHNPQPQSPNMTVNQLTDQDIASCMLGIHKSSAVARMGAVLECADPELRGFIQQGANNCAEQAYEVWQYLNNKGFYQVPTFEDITTDTMINSYKQVNRIDLNQQERQFVPQF